MGAQRSFEAAVAQRAASQHGLITAAQVRDLGGTPKQVETRLTTGRWLLVERGVYRIAGAPFSYFTRVLGATMASGGIASHRCAAVLWGLDGFREGSPEVSIARGRSCRRDGIRVHLSRDLHLGEPRRVHGIPVTGVARTLLDLGAVATMPEVEAAVFGAIDRKLVTWDRLAAVVVDHERRRRPGLGTLRLVRERNFGERVPASYLELVLGRWFERWQLPNPERQVDVHDAAGHVGRLDFAFPKSMLAVETDGRSVHARRQAFDADHLWRNRLRLAGWHLLVFTARHVFHAPQQVHDQVMAAMTLADAGLLGVCPGPRFQAEVAVRPAEGGQLRPAALAFRRTTAGAVERSEVRPRRGGPDQPSGRAAFSSGMQ